MDAEELAYRARALAQAHPLTPLAARYRERVIADEGSSQPLPEIGIWAGAALMGGYCVRRVEEEDLHVGQLAARPSVGADALDELDEMATKIAEGVRGAAPPDGAAGGDAAPLGAERVIAALDRVVASEVSRRVDNWRDSIDDDAWAEIEEYIAWWVVKGYAVRVAEWTVAT